MTSSLLFFQTKGKSNLKGIIMRRVKTSNSHAEQLCQELLDGILTIKNSPKMQELLITSKALFIYIKLQREI